MALATTREKKERARMYLMHAADREEIKEAFAGDIVALQGLKDTRTGETLCDPAEAGHPREDGFSQSRHRDEDRAQDQGRPGEDGDRAVDRARGPLVPSLVDQEFGETILKGMGELHLDIKVDILKRTYGVEANVGAPQVAYRETLARRAEIDYTHKKQTAPASSRALLARAERDRQGQRVRIRGRRRHGAEGIHPRRREGRQLVDNGVLIGFPMVDMKVTLFDGAYHEVDRRQSPSRSPRARP